MQIWDAFPFDQYLSLVPWAGLEFEVASTPRPTLFNIAGVAPEIVASLQEAHQQLFMALGVAISDVVAGRASLGDPVLRVRVEDAYAELIESRPNLREHIRCRREPDGNFHWAFSLDQT